MWKIIYNADDVIEMKRNGWTPKGITISSNHKLLFKKYLSSALIVEEKSRLKFESFVSLQLGVFLSCIIFVPLWSAEKSKGRYLIHHRNKMTWVENFCLMSRFVGCQLLLSPFLNAAFFYEGLKKMIVLHYSPAFGCEFKAQICNPQSFILLATKYYGSCYVDQRLLF